MLLGHALFLDHHSLVQWWTRRDLDILAETGTSVAHCPVVFSRYGQMMEDVGGYIRKGVNVAIGTDTEPQNMAEEVRMASTLVTYSTGAKFGAASSAGAGSSEAESAGCPESFAGGAC